MGLAKLAKKDLVDQFGELVFLEAWNPKTGFYSATSIDSNKKVSVNRDDIDVFNESGDLIDENTLSHIIKNEIRGSFGMVLMNMDIHILPDSVIKDYSDKIISVSREIATKNGVTVGEVIVIYFNDGSRFYSVPMWTGVTWWQGSCSTDFLRWENS